MSLVSVVGIGGAFILWKKYKRDFYSSKEFLQLKEDMKNCVTEANELNNHINELSLQGYDFKKTSQIKGTMSSNGYYKSNREMYNTSYNNVYDCSRSVVKNAQNNPIKYLVKYFNVEISERTLEVFESMLNNYLTIREGQTHHRKQVKEIRNRINNAVPFLIRVFDKKNVCKQLEFNPITVNSLQYQNYKFRYVSANGRNKLETNINFGIDFLEEFIQHIDATIKYKKSAKYQRSLMTKALRTKIKVRDNYTCKCCGISAHNTPNLLLEIDHIIPVSKGGQTSEDNLQCLCWKCNRSKGAR